MAKLKKWGKSGVNPALCRNGKDHNLSPNALDRSLLGQPTPKSGAKRQNDSPILTMNLTRRVHIYGWEFAPQPSMIGKRLSRGPAKPLCDVLPRASHRDLR